MQYKKKEERAEIFNPYDSLKGFFEMIHEQEKDVVVKKELSEDDLEELDEKIHHVKPGMMVKVIYFKNNQYIEKTGMISKLDLEYSKFITIVDTKIPLNLIVSIEIQI